MTTLEIPEKDFVIDIPSCWEELSVDQFDFIMQQFLKLQDKKISILDLKVFTLYYMLGIERTPYNQMKDKYRSKIDLQERNGNIAQLIHVLDWLFVDKEIKGEKHQILSFNSVQNLVPELEIDQDKYVGPDHALSNCSFGEYRNALEYFRKFGQSHRDQDLNFLIATLYRPERDNYQVISLQDDFDGQKRKSFNSNHTHRYARQISEIPFYKRYAIYMWFGHCVNFLRQGEIQIEGRSICLGDLYSKQSDDEESNETDLGFTGLLFRLADEGTFGSMQQTDEANLYDVMLKIYNWKLEADKLKKIHNDTDQEI